MAKEVIKNAKGQPFSKWKPAEKFAYVLAKEASDVAEFCSREVLFDSRRQWRFDFAWEPVRVAVEIQGFGFGHQAQQHMAADNEKANAALEQGWRVFRFDSRLLGSRKGVSDAVAQVVEFICKAEPCETES